MARPRKADAQRADTRIAYRRVSTEDQARSGLGLDAQREKLLAEAARREWTDVEWLTDDGYSAKTLNRPALQEALSKLRDGEASVLVVAKLDRLSRSVVDFANLITRAEREGWAIVSLDPEIDMTSATGRMFAKLVVLISEWEREIIGERTSAALQAKKHQGARLGRPRGLPISVVYRIGELRGQGETLQTIADMLGAERVPTRDGGRWWPSTIAAVLESIRLDKEAEEQRGRPEQQRYVGEVRHPYIRVFNAAANEIGVSAVSGDEVTRYSDLRQCPDCGQVVNLEEWEQHLDDHRAIGDEL